MSVCQRQLFEYKWADEGNKIIEKKALIRYHTFTQ